MVPERREAIWARQVEYAESRVIIGMHYPLDPVAGGRAGTAMAVAMFADPLFKADFERAKAEVARPSAPASFAAPTQRAASSGAGALLSACGHALSLDRSRAVIETSRAACCAAAIPARVELPMRLTRRNALTISAGASLPRFAIAQADTRPTVTVAVQKIANSNTLDALREQSNVGTRMMTMFVERLIDLNYQGQLEPQAGPRHRVAPDR
jgi:hypothetical protein